MGFTFANRMKRTLELTKMATKIGLKELTSGDIQSRIEQAKILTESLSHLRGAAMKAGQILSLDLDNYFPPEAIQILSQLQNQVAENPELRLDQLLVQELSPAQRQRLSGIEPKPFAAASMGQVYRARLDGHPVVLKAQYPGLEESVEGDVAALKKIMSALVLLTGRQMKLDPLFKEIHSLLIQETRYLHEAEALSRFKTLLSSHQWQAAPIVTPNVHRDMSTDKVLTLSFEPGLTLKEWIDTKPTRLEKERIAKSLLELYIMEFFAWGFVQTDPNPGNFLIRKSPDLEMVILDYGATKEYSYEFRRAYAELLKSVENADPAVTVQKAIAMGLLDPRENKETQEIFGELLKLGMSPFFAPTTKNRFNFKDDHFLKENSRLSRLLIQQLKYSPPPYQLIFLHRKLGGVFALLRKLEVELDLRPYWDLILKLVLQPDSQSPSIK